MARPAAYLFLGLLIVGGFFVIAKPASAVLINFQTLADGSIGESAWNTLRFKADGTHTTNAGDAFLDITGSNGSNSYAYMDSNVAGLGVCGKLKSSPTPNEVHPNSKTNLCDPGSDDNVTYHSGTPETLHFVFDSAVVINNIWLNNNHDGDRSLLDDFVSIGTNGSTSPVQLDNGGYKVDSLLNLDLNLAAGIAFDVGFYANLTYNDPNSASYDQNSTCFDSTNFNNCEFYVSKLEYTKVPPPPNSVPEPLTLALLGIGLIGVSLVRKPKTR